MSEEKKIFVDEDWKTKVQSEKEDLERQMETDAETGGDGDSGPADSLPMPHASFEVHLSMLATEAAIAMGQLRHSASGEPEKNLEQARYLIDTIEMLEEKTRGNLTDQETTGLQDLLHQLRMLFVAAQSQG